MRRNPATKAKTPRRSQAPGVVFASRWRGLSSAFALIGPVGLVRDPPQGTPTRSQPSRYLCVPWRVISPLLLNDPMDELLRPVSGPARARRIATGHCVGKGVGMRDGEDDQPEACTSLYRDREKAMRRLGIEPRTY